MLKNIPQQNIMNELHNFLNGALKNDQSNLIDLTKTALKLMKRLPATRSAIFEYFCNVFIELSSNYIQGIEREINTGEIPTINETDEAILSEIYVVFVGFINENPTSWAPIISTWSLELLGEISTKFAGRAHISASLNETLQLWMNCAATKILVDINTKCLSSLMHSDTEACISALLDTSIKHSPNFDWVVAHVGSCFPNTVITRVLSCGLKDFSQNKSYQQSSDSPKLKSVVGILGHLANSHGDDIKSAILEMFNWSIQTNFQDVDLIKIQKKATVPFILQLSLLSSTIFSSICTNIKQILSVEIIEKCYNYIDDWCKYFGSTEALEEILITLILNCDAGGMQIINLLFDCCLIEGNSTRQEIIKDKSLELLQYILLKLDETIRYNNNKSINLINSFINELNELHKSLLDFNEIKSQTCARIIIFLGYNNPSILIKSINYLFKYSKSNKQLNLLIKILTNEFINKSTWSCIEKDGHFSIVIEEILSKDMQGNNQQELSQQICDNLLVLLRWEKSGKINVLNSQIISKAIKANLVNFTLLFADENNTFLHTLAEILDLLEIPTINNLYNPPIQVILNSTQAIINYFFICCRDDGSVKKMRGYHRCAKLLKRLCIYSKVAKVLALRELLERALFRNDNILFGTKLNGSAFDTDSNNKLLWKQNKKFNKTIPLTKHSSVFNGGIIGSGKRKAITPNQLPDEVIQANSKELINIIKACCSLPDDLELKYSNDVSLDSVTLVSLLLVQFVSPDVMYNGLPWPDEEFSKVTVERDLFIRRLFTNAPILWDLLGFVAIYRPAICYCSVLLRALIATLIHQWKSMGEQCQTYVSHNYQPLINTTVKVLDIMALGQLLPPPLSSIRDVLPNLKCFEIVAILRDCIWCYMRDNIPSPALFSCDSNGYHWRDPTVSRPLEIYTNTLRIIMQRNIKSLGHMYAQMFVNLPKRD